MVVVVGLGLYVGVVLVLKDQDIILAKNTRTDTLHKPDEVPSTQADNKDNQAGDNQAGQTTTLGQIATNDKDTIINPSTESHAIGVDSIEEASKEHTPNNTHKDTDDGTKSISESTPNLISPAQTSGQNHSNSDKSEPDSEIIQKESRDKYLYAKHRINIRKAPSSEAGIISRAVVGEALELLGIEGDWSRVKNSYGVEGYVSSRLLAPKPKQSDGEPYVVLPTALNVRLKADSESAIIGRLSHNMRIGVIETHGGWGKVQLPNKQYGYVSLEHLKKLSGN